MDLRHLETFLKIAELKSFTRAADDLYLTQPTISKQIVDLERHFGVRLLDRTKRMVTLTKAGDILLKYAKEIITLKKDATEAIAAFKGLKHGVITVGASTIPGIYILPKVLATFRKEYQGMEVKLLIGDTKEIIGKMEDGSIDVGFVGAKENLQKIEYKKFINDTIIIIGPVNFPDTIDLSQTETYPLINREVGSGTRNSFESSLRSMKNKIGAHLKTVAEMSDTEAIKEAVKNGMGMAYISRLAVVDELASRKIKYISVRGIPEIRRSFYVISRKGRTLPPHVKALLDIIDTWRKHEKV